MGYFPAFREMKALQSLETPGAKSPSLAFWLVGFFVFKDRRSLTAEDRVRSRASRCEISGGQSGTGTGFSPSTWGIRPTGIILRILHVRVHIYTVLTEKGKQASPW
jgi:hypothetical protein